MPDKAKISLECLLFIAFGLCWPLHLTNHESCSLIFAKIFAKKCFVKYFLYFLSSENENVMKKAILFLGLLISFVSVSNVARATHLAEAVITYEYIGNANIGFI